jgi:hypothetical protein
MDAYLRKLISKYNKTLKVDINNLYEKLNSQSTKEEKATVGLSIVLKHMELPELVFAGTLLNILTIQLDNFINNHENNQFIQRKTSEILDILLRGYQITDDDIKLIESVNDNKRNDIHDKVELYVYEMKRIYVSCYLRKQLFPYWKNILSDDCIQYIEQLNDNSVVKMNKFIPIQDTLNAVYFVENRPEDWRQQLDKLGVKYD